MRATAAGFYLGRGAATRRVNRKYDADQSPSILVNRGLTAATGLNVQHTGSDHRCLECIFIILQGISLGRMSKKNSDFLTRIVKKHNNQKKQTNNNNNNKKRQLLTTCVEPGQKPFMFWVSTHSQHLETTSYVSPAARAGQSGQSESRCSFDSVIVDSFL